MSTETDQTPAGQADFEQRLRRELGHVTVRLPADMVARAHRGHRRRLAVTRVTAITGGAAVVAAAAVLATAVLPTSERGGQPAPATGRSAPAAPQGAIPPFGMKPIPASDSLTARQAKGDILWIRSTTQAIPASDTIVDTIWNYKSASRDLTYYPNGKPWDDDSEATVRGQDGKLTETHTVVQYDQGTYSVTDSPASSQPGTPFSCGFVESVGAGLLNFQGTPDIARQVAGCKGVTVTRGQQIDGIAAIKLGLSHSETLWVNARTYLPIELTLPSPKGQMPPAGYNNAKSPGVVDQFSYLPPTPQNLSYLVAPIPAGFGKG